LLEGDVGRKRVGIGGTLDALNKLPLQVVTNLLPDLIVRNQSVTALKQRKVDLVLVEFEELEELVEDVAVAEEVGSVIGTVE
jgi:hypothetical protein